MVFSSILFLFHFMPIAFILYYISPKFLKNTVLLLLSLIFYAWGEPRYVVIMFFSILVDFCAGLGIEWGRKKQKNNLSKLFIGISLFSNLGLLGFFKYSNFFIENVNAVSGLSISPIDISLPLGISFYTFQTLSYSIDVYRGKVQAEHNLINFGAFVCLFPQLIAGPIVTYNEINRELKTRSLNLGQIENGICLFILGLGSKVLLANNIGMLWNDIGTIGYQNISTPLAWLGILSFSLQIYFDFSGYSLMAIGLGKMLGFEFPKNFNFPYISKSVTDFWRRWHMTLSGWFKEYLYIPLGGNRKGTARTFFNLFIVWFATGFWHGASWTFILWGLYFFILLVIEKFFLLKRLDQHPFLAHSYLIFVILIGWVLFAVPTLPEVGLYFSKMFSLSFSNDWQYYLSNYAVVFLIAIFCSTPCIKSLFKRKPAPLWLRILGLMIIFILSVAYLVDATYNPFLYFRF